MMDGPDPKRRRARSVAAKRDRRDQIVATVRDLWAERTFATLTMADVAERCGLAKGTLYLYFATKEQLLLGLLEAELVAWFDDLDARLAISGRSNAAELADLIVAALTLRPVLVRLLPIAASILEQNIAPDAALSYKQLLLDRSLRSGVAIDRCYGLSSGDGTWLLLQLYALAVGLGQMADPAPVVAAVLRDPAMAPLRVDFAPALRRSLLALLHGIVKI